MLCRDPYQNWYWTCNKLVRVGGRYIFSTLLYIGLFSHTLLRCHTYIYYIYLYIRTIQCGTKYLAVCACGRRAYHECVFILFIKPLNQTRQHRLQELRKNPPILCKTRTVFISCDDVYNYIALHRWKMDLSRHFWLFKKFKVFFSAPKSVQQIYFRTNYSNALLLVFLFFYLFVNWKTSTQYHLIYFNVKVHSFVNKIFTYVRFEYITEDSNWLFVYTRISTKWKVFNIEFVMWFKIINNSLI